MSFAGPGKTHAELERAIGGRLYLLSLESVAELHRAAEVAKKLGRRQDVTLRVNPLHTPKEFAMKMGGGASQFGVAEEDAAAALAAVRAEPQVRLAGIHVFAGTQCLEEAAILENLRSADGTWSPGGSWWKSMGTGRDGSRGLKAWNADVVDWGPHPRLTR
mgnify:CR=1 FL=1